jgi:polyphosphate kinase
MKPHVEVTEEQARDTGGARADHTGSEASVPDRERSSDLSHRPRTPPDPSPVPESISDLADPGLYVNREFSWLNFNFRILQQAEDEGTPLLERLKFVSIVASNIDEFFMKRIGGLKQQVGARLQQRTLDGRTPEEQIDACYELVRTLEERQRHVLRSITRALPSFGIRVSQYADLNERQREELRTSYLENIFPLVTPQATDPAHPFPFISNLSLNLLVSLRYPRESVSSLARVKVPVGTGIPRFMKVADENVFVALEDVMMHNLELLFPGMEIENCEMFRVTRNANTELEEGQAEDLLALIETGLRERRFAPIVRMEVAEGMSPLHRGRLAAELGLDEHADVFEVPGFMAMRDLLHLTTIADSSLTYPAHRPADHPALKDDDNIFHVIRGEGPILLHHPYQSFSTSVERFLREAASDPKVRAIKMTLYRTSDDSKAIDYLIEVARNGKQVAVVLELKARFEEEANIRWANRLEERGVHVTYGVVGLMTHCKAVLVVRQDYSGLKRYAHIGTGNYDADTARQYSDLGLLTCDPEVGRDLTELFNYLTTGYEPKRNYIRVLHAPTTLKPALLEKIDREIALHRDDRPGVIQMKMNALEDADITRALYRASQAGVRVDLILRDTCRLRPGVPGLSETVRVVSIVGRFLEHSRIFYFGNGDDPEYYIGSADCLQGSLESRVEILVPIDSPPLCQDLRYILDVTLGDDCGGWDMLPDGSYARRTPDDPIKPRDSQQQLLELAQKRFKQATRLRRRKPRVMRLRNVR